MVVVGLDVGIFLGHVLEGAPPEIVPEGQHVRLGHQGEPLFLVSLAGIVERPADAALAAFAGVDGRLHGHFVGRVLLEESAHAHVHVLGVLADHDEVDVLGALAGQRRFHAGEQFHRPEVDVLIEAEPQFQEQALFEDAGGDLRMAHGAQQNGREGAKLVERLGRHDFAGPQIALAAEIEVLQLQLDVFQGGDRLEDFHAFGGHFRPRAVAADHRHSKNVVTHGRCLLESGSLDDSLTNGRHSVTRRNAV